jgi:hypothetical protein
MTIKRIVELPHHGLCFPGKPFNIGARHGKLLIPYFEMHSPPATVSIADYSVFLSYGITR